MGASSGAAGNIGIDISDKLLGNMSPYVVPPLPEPVYHGAVGVLSDHLFLCGGSDTMVLGPSSKILGQCYYHVVGQSSGWDLGPKMNLNRSEPAFLAFRDELWIIGGELEGDKDTLRAQ